MRRCNFWQRVVAAIVAGCLVEREAAATPPTDRELQAAVDRLASSDFRQREQATLELARAGLLALPHVEAARRSKDAEARNRAVRIMAGWLTAKDAKLAVAAEEILRTAAHDQGPSRVAAQVRLSANQLRREIEFVDEMNRLVPLQNLLLM
jgi:hypothetical protein